MKTWKMIKELTENPDKEFKMKNEKIIVTVSNFKDDGEIVWYNNLPGHYHITISDEWEEVKEPADFITAVKRQ